MTDLTSKDKVSQLRMLRLVLFPTRDPGIYSKNKRLLDIIKRTASISDARALALLAILRSQEPEFNHATSLPDSSIVIQEELARHTPNALTRLTALIRRKEEELIRKEQKAAELGEKRRVRERQTQEDRRHYLVEQLGLPKNTSYKAAKEIERSRDIDRGRRREKREERRKKEEERRKSLNFLAAQEALHKWRKTARLYAKELDENPRVVLALLGKPQSLGLQDLFKYLAIYSLTRPASESSSKPPFAETRASQRRREKWQLRLEVLEHIIDNRIHDYLEAARAKDRLTLDIKADGQADAALATSLAAAACQALDGCNGYIYLKTWGLSDGTRWYKIGITNDPQRRDSEQNVLPVPAITLRLIRLPSMDHARAIEQAFQCVLADLRICNASNRELFSLSDQQLAALVNAMEGINARLDYNEALSAPH